jgi:hypothetical protein
MVVWVGSSYGRALLACVVLGWAAGSTRADETNATHDERTPSVRPLARDAGKLDPATITALAQAAKAALVGPEINGLNVKGDKFTVHQAKRTRVGRTITVDGQISHELAMRPDDQVYYTIKKTGSDVQVTKFDIQRGGIGAIVGYPTKLAKDATGIPIPNGLESAIDYLGEKLDDSWESSADLIVAAIGLQARGITVIPSGGPSSPGDSTTPPPTEGVVQDNR